MEGAPEDDSLPSRINRFELSVVDAFTDRCGECENTGIAMLIDLVFQIRGEDRFRRCKKIIDDIEIIFNPPSIIPCMGQFFATTTI